jgi:hypothetical protein
MIEQIFSSIKQKLNLSFMVLRGTTLALYEVFAKIIRNA